MKRFQDPLLNFPFVWNESFERLIVSAKSLYGIIDEDHRGYLFEHSDISALVISDFTPGESFHRQIRQMRFATNPFPSPKPAD